MGRTRWVFWMVALVGPWGAAGAEAPAPKLKAPPLKQLTAAPEMARIKAALSKKITFDFVETPLRDVVTFLGQTLGVNIVLDPTLDPGKPVTLRVGQMAGGHAIAWVARLAGGEMRIEDGAVFIGPPKPKGPLGEPRLFGKAQLKLGKLAAVEIYLYEDLMDPELRRLLTHALRMHLVEQLHEAERRMKGEEGERERMRQLKEQRLRKLDGGAKPNAGQF